MTNERCTLLAQLQGMIVKHDAGFLQPELAIEWARRVADAGAPLARCSPLVALAELISPASKKEISPLLAAARIEIKKATNDNNACAQEEDLIVKEIFSTEVARYLDGQIMTGDLLKTLEAIASNFSDRTWWVGFHPFMMGAVDVDPTTLANEVPWLARPLLDYLEFTGVDPDSKNDVFEPPATREDPITWNCATQSRAESPPRFAPEDDRGYGFQKGKVGLFREGETFYLARITCDHIEEEYVEVAIEPLDRSIPTYITPSDSLYRNDDDTLWMGVRGRWIIYFDSSLVAAALRVMNLPYFAQDPGARMYAFTSLMLAATSDEWQKKQSATRSLASQILTPLTYAQNRKVVLARELAQEGRRLRCTGDNLEAAIVILRAALDIAGPLLGDVQDIAVFRNDLGLLLRSKGDYKEAVYWFMAAHEYFARYHAISHADFVTTLHNLGATQLLIGLEQEGEAALRQALSLHEEFQTTSKLDWSNTCWLLAEALTRPEKKLSLSARDKAIALFEQALDLRYDEGLEASSEMAEINVELARVLRDAGANFRAEVFFERALLGFELARGREHSKTAEVLEELIQFLLSVGREEQAAILKRAMGY